MSSLPPFVLLVCMTLFSSIPAQWTVEYRGDSYPLYRLHVLVFKWNAHHTCHIKWKFAGIYKEREMKLANVKYTHRGVIKSIKFRSADKKYEGRLKIKEWTLERFTEKMNAGEVKLYAGYKVKGIVRKTRVEVYKPLSWFLTHDVDGSKAMGWFDALLDDDDYYDYYGQYDEQESRQWNRGYIEGYQSAMDRLLEMGRED